MLQESWEKAELRKAEKTMSVIIENKEDIAKLAAQILFESKKEEKKENPVADTPKDEAAPKETAVDRKTVRAFLADKSRSGKTSEVKNLIEQFGFQKLSDVPDEKLPELYEKAQVL